MDKSSSRTATEQSCADSDMTVLDMSRRVVNVSDVSEQADESSQDLVDGGTLPRQQLRRTDPVAKPATLLPVDETVCSGERPSLVSTVCRQDLLIAAPSVEGFEPAYPVAPHQETSLDTLPDAGLQPREAESGPAHPPLQRTGSVSVAVRGKEEATSAEALRKSASTDDCTPAARTFAAAASDSSCPSDTVRARHNSSVAHDAIRLRNMAGLEGTWCNSGGSSSKSRHSSGGDSAPLPPQRTCCGASSGYSSYQCCGVTHAGGGYVSDVSSLLESGQTTDIGCERDVSESDDCGDWLHEFETAQPYLPKFWLIIHVVEKVVSMCFHCRYKVFLCFLALNVVSIEFCLNILL